MTSPDDPRFSDDEHSSSNLRFAISMCCQLLNGTTSHANYTLLNIYKTAAPRLALANKLILWGKSLYEVAFEFLNHLHFHDVFCIFIASKIIFVIVRPKNSKCDFIRFYYPIVKP